MPRTPKKTKPVTDPVSATKGIDPETLARDLEDIENPPSDDTERSKVPFPANLPVLPIRDQVYFPHMMFPLLVGREKGVRALEDAAALDRRIVIVAQRDLHVEDPGPEDIYGVGIVVEIMQVLRVPDGTVRVMLEGLERCRIVKMTQTEPFYRANISAIRGKGRKDLATEALMRTVIAQFEHVVSVSKTIQPEALINVVNTEEPGRLADVITPYLRQMRVTAQQEILETADVGKRLNKLAIFLKKEADILELQKNIRSRVERRWARRSASSSCASS